jgi:hypothetical protein
VLGNTDELAFREWTDNRTVAELVETRTDSTLRRPSTVGRAHNRLPRGERRLHHDTPPFTLWALPRNASGMAGMSAKQQRRLTATSADQTP